MQINIEVTPEHWWIERCDRADRPTANSSAEAMVRFRGKQNGQNGQDGKKYTHEEFFTGTPEECLAFVRKYFPEGGTHVE